MELNHFLSPRMLASAAIVGLVGAAGVFIYEQVYAEKRRSMLVHEVAKLDRQVASMRVELEALREVQKESQLRRIKHKKTAQKREAKRMARAAAPSGDTVDGPEQSCASDSEYFTDYQSVIGTDGEMDSEEFYDVHTDEDEDDTLRETRNGHPAIPDPFDEEKSEKGDSPKVSPRNAT